MDIDITEYLLNVMKIIPRVSSVDAQIVMRDMYDETFGICNHAILSKQHPLSSVSFHKAENVLENSLIEEAMRKYMDFGIKDKFGISFDIFMSYPREYVEMFYKIATEDSSKRSQAISQIEKEMSKM